MRAKLIAIVLLLSLWPSGAEICEMIVHRVEYGDQVHAAADRHGTTPIGTGEHGCSGTLHFCSCCAGPPLAIARTVVMLHPDRHAILVPVLATGAKPESDAPAPELRPPIA